MFYRRIDKKPDQIKWLLSRFTTLYQQGLTLLGGGVDSRPFPCDAIAEAIW